MLLTMAALQPAKAGSAAKQGSSRTDRTARGTVTRDIIFSKTPPVLMTCEWEEHITTDCAATELNGETVNAVARRANSSKVSCTRAKHSVAAAHPERTCRQLA